MNYADFEMNFRIKRHLALDLLNTASEEYERSRKSLGDQINLDESFWKQVYIDFVNTFLHESGWDVEELLS